MNSPEEELTKVTGDTTADKTQLIVSGNQGVDSSQHNSSAPNWPEQGSRKPGEALIGKTIGGHYELLSVLGTGGMSVVYKANHNLLHKIVAIKVLSPQRILDEDAMKRFQQEAKAACHLGHQNIVVTRDFGLDAEGRPFLVMDFVSGKSLDKLIAEHSSTPIDTKQTVRIITQIGAALAYAHNQGVVHRDIKPANIIVAESSTGEMNATLVDFGIAKIVTGEEGQNLTQTGEIFGSPLYMSPEQCLGKRVDSRSDVYSLGCVLYEMMTGEPPFMGDGPLATLMMHVNDKPDFAIEKKSGEVETRIMSIVRKCLAKDPFQRYQTMEEFGQDLDRATTLSTREWQKIWKIEAAPDSDEAVLEKQGFINEVLADKVVKTKDMTQIWLAAAVVIGVVLAASFLSHAHNTAAPGSPSGTNAGSGDDSNRGSDEGENWLSQGRVYYRDKNYAAALGAYVKAEKLDPTLIWVHQNKAEAYQHLGEEQRAEAELKKQLKLFPYHWGPLNSAADTWSEQHRAKESKLYRTIAAMDKRIAFNPSDAQAYEERAQCFDQLGESQLAAVDKETRSRIPYRNN